MAQRPAVLTPYASPRHFLGAELRCWPERRGMSLAQLAAAVFVSADLVAKFERAQRTASAQLMAACDAVLDTGGALARLLAYAELAASVSAAPLPGLPLPVVPPLPVVQPVSVRLTVTAEVEAVPELSAGGGAGDGGARVYSLAGRRRRRDGR